MKKLFTVPLFILLSCSPGAENETSTQTDTTVNLEPSLHEENSSVPEPTPVDTITAPSKDTTVAGKTHANQRFRNVTVKKVGDHKFEVAGQGQIFEASFSWVVEDGHDELAKGHEMTEAGAPEWGSFKFVVDVAKKRANSTLTLVIFEISAKDGSRVHELPIPLY